MNLDLEIWLYIGEILRGGETKHSRIGLRSSLIKKVTEEKKSDIEEDEVEESGRETLDA